MSKYLVVIEKAKGNLSAYCPDLPGGVATGETKREVEKNIKTAIAFHLEGLREQKKPIPPHSATAEYIGVPV
jgi:predicted RNase H-like HicB family nuclease